MPSKKPHVFKRTVPDRVVELPPGEMRVEHAEGEFVQAVVASALTRVSWDRSVVASGGTCALEIAAWGVAPGQRCLAHLTDARGRRLATLEHSARKVGADWKVSRAELRLFPDKDGRGGTLARVLVPPEVTKEAEGHLTARVELPEVGIGWFSQALRVGPRVAVRSVKFLEEKEDRALTEARSEQFVRLQAQVDVFPKEGLPEGTPARVRLYRQEAFEQPADLKTGAAPLIPVQELKARVTGPPGQQGVEMLWEASLERVMENGAQQSRRLLGSQWLYDERAKQQGAPPKSYLGAQLMAEVEVWGARGRTTDPGSRGGSGWLTMLDDVDVQVVLAEGNNTAEGESGAPLREAPAPSEARALSEAEVEVKLPDGTKRTGRLGKGGRLDLKDVPPGRCFLTLPGLREQPPSARSAKSNTGRAEGIRRAEIRALLRPDGPTPEVELLTGVPARLCLEVRLPMHSA